MRQAVLFETLDALNTPEAIKTKTCIRCRKTKPVTAFHSGGRRKRRRPDCAECRREARHARGERRIETPDERLTRKLWSNYRLTREQYTALVDAQLGVCAICGKAPGEGKRLFVDHCHATGVVRALLCTTCNVAVGFYEIHGSAAAEYLGTYGAGNPLLKRS
ncbi:endonuclease domain-containing protein [Streptomyces sp. ActVer]|uniref:endonuclease domain-containing protein n=1 Tax=Streptomyces sp. ActVer TaxID=3014558 RepID=UPI0022B338E0|nr:endonuclease domain-containing protein [Streptomyces sp. ActVer]MCZ4515671.1 endonuclease domain-containing protein [Streptomyces sp. ActVer]